MVRGGMEIFLIIGLAPLIFIAGGIVAGCLLVDGSVVSKVAAGCFFGAGAFLVMLVGWWAYLWLLR